MMDDGFEKLREAEKIKQTGNDFYKSGKFEDARRSYNQVLDQLTSQTSLTNEEKEKRDNLVLTTHLNLAACELKLGDNAKVTEHCSLALQMDKENVKAYFRRGQAYYNNKDYDLALRDYLEAERLEPQNPAVRKQMGELLADKEEEDCHEMMVMLEGDEEAGLEDFVERCRKGSRHSEYIPASQFCLEHLPEQYRTDKMLACVKALITLTVLLIVGGSSEKRPEIVPGTKKRKYPFSGPKYKDVRRCGSGHINSVSFFPFNGNKLCPCDKCTNSGQPKTQFAEIEIFTAAHVIFDSTEGKKSTCYFEYDSDQTPRVSCAKISTAVKVDSKVEEDLSIVTFVTHDLQLARKLYEANEIYNTFCQQIKHDFGLVQAEAEEEMELSVKVSNISDKFREILHMFKLWRGSLEEIMNGDAKQMWKDYSRKYNITPSKGALSLYGNCLLDKAKGGNMCEGMLEEVSGIYEDAICSNGPLQNLKDNFHARLKEEGEQSMLERYKLLSSDVKSIVKCLECFFDESNHREAPDQFYNSSHPLAIVVSHPHGLQKQISLGEVTRRTTVTRHDVASYQYTNCTCQGSSGAPVYIMGKLGTAAWAHVHSKMVQVQTSQSGASMDF